LIPFADANSIKLMVTFRFSLKFRLLLMQVRYEIVRTASGQLIGIVRNKATGRFAAQAFGTVVKNSPLAPLIAAAPFALLGGLTLLSMAQNHMGFRGVNSRVEEGFEETYTGLMILKLDCKISKQEPIAGSTQFRLACNPFKRVWEFCKQLQQ
jgi:hypothetical protein